MTEWPEDVSATQFTQSTDSSTSRFSVCRPVGWRIQS